MPIVFFERLNFFTFIFSIIFYLFRIKVYYFKISKFFRNKKTINILNKLNIIYELYELIINIYNNTNKDKFLLLRKELLLIYNNIKELIIKYNGF